MFSSQRIFVGFDFSPSSEEALRQASVRAAATGARLAVCHIIPNELRSNLFFPQLSEKAALEVPVEVNAIAESLATRVSALCGREGEDVEIVVDHGTPYAEILNRAEAWGADLIVVGSHGLAGASAIRLGGVTTKVIRYARSAVLVARTPSARGTIVVGTDFSDPALPAVEAAVETAHRVNGKVVIVHVLELCWALTAAGTIIGAYDEMEEFAHDRLERILHQFEAAGEVFVKRGNAGPTLISVAAQLGAELLVVGTVGQTAIHRLLLGSVAEMAASRAPCSVLIVRLHPAAVSAARESSRSAHSASARAS